MRVIINSGNLFERIAYWIIRKITFKLSYINKELNKKDEKLFSLYLKTIQYFKKGFRIKGHKRNSNELIDNFTKFINKEKIILIKIFLINSGKGSINAHCKSNNRDIFIKWVHDGSDTERVKSLHTQYEMHRKLSKQSKLFYSPIKIGKNYLILPFYGNYISLKELFGYHETGLVMNDIFKLFSLFFQEILKFYKKNAIKKTYSKECLIKDLACYKSRTLHFSEKRIFLTLLSAFLFLFIRKKYLDNYQDLMKLHKRQHFFQKYWIHGDLQENNILINPATKETIVVDLEDSGEGHFIFDVSYFITRMLLYLSFYGKDPCLQLINESRKRIKEMGNEFEEVFTKLIIFQIQLSILVHGNTFRVNFLSSIKQKIVLLNILESIASDSQ